MLKDGRCTVFSESAEAAIEAEVMPENGSVQVVWTTERSLEACSRRAGISKLLTPQVLDSPTQ